MTIFLYCFIRATATCSRYDVTSTQPLLQRPRFQNPNLEHKYLWKHLSVRRMVYIIPNFQSSRHGEFCRKNGDVICTLKFYFNILAFPNQTCRLSSETKHVYCFARDHFVIFFSENMTA